MDAILPPFQQLLDRNRRDVLAYLIAMVGPDEAEDCFQETFLAALKAYPDLRDGRNLRGWLFTIAHRKALDSERGRRRRAAPAGNADEIAELTAALSRAAAVDPGPPNGEIWDAVDELPPKQRAAVTMRFLADLSHREIAAATDCSEAAARRNLHEGLSKLREVWT